MSTTMEELSVTDCTLLEDSEFPSELDHGPEQSSKDQNSKDESPRDQSSTDMESIDNSERANKAKGKRAYNNRVKDFCVKRVKRKRAKGSKLKRCRALRRLCSYRGRQRFLLYAVILTLLLIAMSIIGGIGYVIYSGTYFGKSGLAGDDTCPESCQIGGFDTADPTSLDYLSSLFKVYGFERCCADIGCFDKGYPFHKLPLPSCIDNTHVTYTLYHGNNNTSATIELGSPIPDLFQGQFQTIFITHGYYATGNERWLHDLKDALLKKNAANVILLDWYQFADRVYYSQSASDTRTIGAYTSCIMNQLVEEGGASYSDIWCIGHSLGAHICGHAGIRTSRKIGRITGLDPAGPCFECVTSLKVGLHPDCAQTVDVLHTDTKDRVKALDYRLGTIRTLGHLDFYPNGIGYQPGCLARRRRRQVLSASCSHSRSIRLFTEAIESDEGCLAYFNCNSTEEMPQKCVMCPAGACAAIGYNASYPQGIYYFETNMKYPYCN